MSLRSPQEYVQSLRDGRVVYFRERRVTDVTEHPVISVRTPRRRFSEMWLPDATGFVDHMPRTSTGKLSKTVLRDRFKDYLAR